MAATDGQIILAASRFGDITPLYLRDFSKQKFPVISKIVKGQHQNLGVPTLSAPSLQSTALFLNAGKKQQILAQPIKIKEGRKTTNVGSKVLIPETYSGYFELLSEDGRSTRCIDSVLELSKRRNCRVLVRESFRCTQLNRTIHAGELLITINENGKYLQCKNIKDEIINLPLDTKAKFSPIAKEDSISGVHTVKNLLLKRMPVIVRLVHGSAPKGIKHPFIAELRLLGCMEIDRIFALPLQKDSDIVPVPMNAKLKLQRAKNMEQLEQLIEYTRFLEKAQRLLADARDRLQIVDLKLSQKEKHDFMFNNYNKLPVILLSSSVNMTAIATNELMENGYMLRKNVSFDIYKKTQSTQSSPNVFESNVDIAEEYNEIDHIYDYVRGLTPLSKGVLRFQSTCETLTLRSQKTDSSDNYCSLIHTSPALVQNTNGETNGNNCGHIINNKNNLSLAHNNLNNNNTYCNNNNNYSSLESNKQTSSSHNSSNQSNSNYRNQNPQTQHHSIAGINQYQHMYVQDEIKPVPPPIETIPGKKILEKRQRPVLPKLYLKNINSVNNNNSSDNSPAGTSHQHLIHHNISDLSTASAAGSGVGATSQCHHHHQQNDLTCNKNLMLTNQQTSYNITNNIATPSSAGILCSKNSVLEPQSPLFHIRYKSLSNLQLTPESNTLVTPTISTSPKGQPVPPVNVLLRNDSILNTHTHLTQTNTALCKISSGGMVGGISNVHNPREGTLDSSRSGGRASGDSNKLPEKKTRRLSRPRSLSNLVWDFRTSKEKSKKKLYIHHIDQRQQTTLYL